MRTNEERIEAMHRRAAELEREQRVRKARFAGTAAALVSFATVILLAVMMPDLSQVEHTTANPAGTSGFSSWRASPHLRSSALPPLVFCDFGH